MGHEKVMELLAKHGVKLAHRLVLNKGPLKDGFDRPDGVLDSPAGPALHPEQGRVRERDEEVFLLCFGVCRRVGTGEEEPPDRPSVLAEKANRSPDPDPSGDAEREEQRPEHGADQFGGDISQMVPATVWERRIDTLMLEQSASIDADRGRIEVALHEHMAVFRYDDRPGIVGAVGRILGEAGVNIAGMQVSRDRKGGHALVAMTVDGAIPGPVLDEIVAEIGAATARQADLTE